MTEPGKWVLGESYPMNTNTTGFRSFSRILHPFSLDESCLSIGRVNPYAAAGGLFGQYKMMQKSSKITETLANRYSSESTSARAF